MQWLFFLLSRSGELHKCCLNYWMRKPFKSSTTGNLTKKKWCAFLDKIAEISETYLFVLTAKILLGCLSMKHTWVRLSKCWLQVRPINEHEQGWCLLFATTEQTQRIVMNNSDCDLVWHQLSMPSLLNSCWKNFTLRGQWESFSTVGEIGPASHEIAFDAASPASVFGEKNLSFLTGLIYSLFFRKHKMTDNKQLFHDLKHESSGTFPKFFHAFPRLPHYNLTETNVLKIVLLNRLLRDQPKNTAQGSTRWACHKIAYQCL